MVRPLHASDVQLLEVGAGTGAAGAESCRAAVETINDVDLFFDMLAMAREHGFWRDVRKGIGEPLDIRGDNNDATLNAGVLAPGCASQSPAVQLASRLVTKDVHPVSSRYSNALIAKAHWQLSEVNDPYKVMPDIWRHVRLFPVMRPAGPSGRARHTDGFPAASKSPLNGITVHMPNPRNPVRSLSQKTKKPGIPFVKFQSQPMA